jgi:hypothetical protein
MIEKAVYHGTIEALKNNEKTMTPQKNGYRNTLPSQRKYGIRNKEIGLKHNKSMSCQRPNVNKNKKYTSISDNVDISTEFF